MKYIVYQTINKVNNKIYIGVHETENPEIFDGYLGCGAYCNKPSSYNKGKTHLHNAILKYGISNFYRLTLKVFDNLEEALDLEQLLVNEEFVKRTDTYNMTVGGGIPPKLNKIIYQFDIDGKLIKTWNSIVSITQYYDCNHDRIWMCIRDKRSFDNCYWSEESEIDISLYHLSARGYIYQYNKDGVLLNEFENATLAAIKLDLDKLAIVNSVYNRTLYSGYYFLKPDLNIQELLYEKSSKIVKSITPVFRYNLNGEFDKEYKSITDATYDTPKTNHGNIIRAIKNNRTCGGYRWSYEKSTTINLYIEKSKKAVKIALYDLNMNLIKIWDSASECKKEYPSCLKVCRKERKSSKGFIFEYIS